MNCASHKMINAVVQHGYSEIRLHHSQCTEGAFRDDICCCHNQNNLDQGHDLWYEGPDLLVLFEEISDIMQCITQAFTLPETVIGLCHYRSEFIGYQSQPLCKTHSVGRHFVGRVLPNFLSEEPAQFAYME